MIKTTIVRDFPGESDVVPAIVRVSTNATFNQITAPGFLKSNPSIAGQEILPTDSVLISYPGDEGHPVQQSFVPQFTNGIITMLATGGGGGGGEITSPIILQSTNDANDFIDCLNTSSTNVFKVDGSGNITGAASNLTGNMALNGTLIGAYKSIVPNNASIYLPLNAANGLLNCTNSGVITLGLNAAINSLPVGYSTTIYLSGSGTITFFTGGSDTATYTPFNAMSQGAVATATLVSIDGSGNGTWAVEITSANISYTNASFSMTGPWASPQNTNILVSKNAANGIVTMNLSDIHAAISGATNNTPIQAAVVLPTQFRPAQTVYSACFLQYGTTGDALGSMNITTSGNVNIVGADLNVPNFAGTTGVTAVGFYGITMSWIAAN